MISRRTRLLARTVYQRFFDNDLFASSLSASNGVMWLLAALATPGVMFSGSQYYFYAHARTFTPAIQDRILFVSQAFHILFAMAIAGVVTMLVWTSLTPDRRDALVLGPLPLKPGEQSRARLLALTWFFAMFTAAVAVPTAVAFTFVTLGDSSLAAVVRGVAGHIAGVTLGSAFVFFALAAVQVVLAAAWGPRAVRLATWPLQALVLLAMVAALSFTGRVADAMLAAAPRDAWVMWNPAAWFVGVYRWIAGEPRELFAVLAVRGVVAAVASVLVTMIAYPLAHERCVRRVIAGEGQRASWWSRALTSVWLASLRPFLPTPLERGLAAFMTATFVRSHTHRFLIGSYLGVGVLFALPLAGRLAGPADNPGVQYAWLSLPLGLLCWGTASLRVAMMLPVDAAANWVFKLTEPVDKRRVLSAAVTVLYAATAVPLALVFGVGATVVASVSLGVTVAMVVLTAGFALVELLTLTLHSVPGTCTYRPGQLRLRVMWPVYLLVWTLVAYVVPRTAVPAVGHLRETLGVLGVLAACGIGLRVWRLSRARRLRGFVYEPPEPVVTTTIDLSSARVS